MGGTTVRAQIRCDDPRLRPTERRQVAATVSRTDGDFHVRETTTLDVTFTFAAVWDVARIASRLELRQTR